MDIESPSRPPRRGGGRQVNAVSKSFIYSLTLFHLTYQ